MGNNNPSSQYLLFDFGDSNNDVIVAPKKRRGRKPKTYQDNIPVQDRVYKMPINKQLLKDMLLDIDSVADNKSDYVKELNKLVGVIFNKHFSKYYTMKEDLESDAILAVYNKRQYYNAEKDAYNFIYAIMRNEMTNKLSKLNRISLIDSYVTFSETSCTKESDSDSIPPNVLKWADYLVGDEDFDYIKIPKKDVLEVMVWLKIHERGQQNRCAPTFILPTENNINALYKLLKLIIGQ